MKTNMKFGIAALVIAVLLSTVFFAPAEDTQKAADKGEEKEEETAAAPWFDKGDELNRLNTYELAALAEKNETVRKMLEEDRKIKPARIESLEDIEHLPENYPEELKKLMIEDYLARQNISEKQNNSSDDFPEPPTCEVNESTTIDTN